MHAQQVLLEGPSITESKFNLQSYVYIQQDARVSIGELRARNMEKMISSLYNCAFE